MIIPLSPLLDWLDRKAQARENRKRTLQQWHFWFAWRPKVLFTRGGPCIVWLTTIARRYSPNVIPHWSYGPIANVLKGAKS